MKIAILTDTNSGITVEHAKEIGVHVIKMPFQVNQKMYLEGEGFSPEDLFAALNSDGDVSTSQVSPGANMEAWDELLKEYDQIIHIPMSSALSATYQTAKQLTLIEDAYAGKVFVVDNKRISDTLYRSVLNAKMMVDKGLSAEEVVSLLELDSLNAEIFVSVETVKYLKKSGRLSPTAATLAGLLGIRPVLKLTDGKLEAYKKVRSIAAAKREMIDAIEAKVNEWPDHTIAVLYSGDESVGTDWADTVRERLNVDVVAHKLPLSLCVHTGPNALGIAITKNFK